MMMYVPKGCAHGFLTLTDDSEVIYLVDEFYSPESERIVRFDDPKFRIEWPEEVRVISDKDRNARDFDPAYHLGG
jgi:dTDP-4-dehydrorhamnose 3,5-epimerase